MVKCVQENCRSVCQDVARDRNEWMLRRMVASSDRSGRRSEREEDKNNNIVKSTVSLKLRSTRLWGN